jgi:hypothetical protein
MNANWFGNTYRFALCLAVLLAREDYCPKSLNALIKGSPAFSKYSTYGVQMKRSFKFWGKSNLSTTTAKKKTFLGKLLLAAIFATLQALQHYSHNRAIKDSPAFLDIF